MVKIIDRRKQAMGGGSKRSLSQIRNIAVHYSATSEGATASFERYWKGTHKWNTGGYHEVILTNGDVEVNYNPDVISNGVGGQNTRMYNICYVGAGKPNAKQLKSLIDRVEYNRKRLNVSVANVKGHREYQGQSTQCPALNMSEFRSKLGKSVANKPASKPKAKGKLTVDGMWGNSTTRELQKALGTPVDGIISNQSRNAVSRSLYGNTVRFGSGGSVVIRALQRKLGVKADGLLGPATVRALQRHLGTVVDGKLSRPSLVVKELQRRLNAGTF